jgi:hypothetical protein
MRVIPQTVRKKVTAFFDLRHLRLGVSPKAQGLESNEAALNKGLLRKQQAGGLFISKIGKTGNPETIILEDAEVKALKAFLNIN